MGRQRQEANEKREEEPDEQRDKARDRERSREQDKDLAPLFVSGMIKLPWPYPNVGELEIKKQDPEGAIAKTGPLAIISRRVSPTLKVSWTVVVEQVFAFLETHGDYLDPDTATWHFRPSIRDLESPVDGKLRKGILYVPEYVPVLMRSESGETASGSVDTLSQMVGGCDPDDGLMFSSARIMGGRGKG